MNIDGLLHMLCTMYLRCVAALSSGLWNIPTPVDQVLDGRVIQTHIKIDALCEQRWPPERHPGKKFGHMLPMLCHQGALGTVCLQLDSDHVCLCQATTYTFSMLTPRHRQAWLLWCRERVDWSVEWCSVVFSDESRFCLYASDGCTRVRCRPGERHLPECIRPRDIGPTSSFTVWGGHQLQLEVTLGVSAG